MITLCDAKKPVRTNTHRCVLPPGHDHWIDGATLHECVCGHRWGTRGMGGVR